MRLFYFVFYFCDNIVLKEKNIYWTYRMAELGGYEKQKNMCFMKWKCSRWTQFAQIKYRSEIIFANYLTNKISLVVVVFFFYHDCNAAMSTQFVCNAFLFSFVCHFAHSVGRRQNRMRVMYAKCASLFFYEIGKK